jgi:ferrochelatase
MLSLPNPSGYDAFLLISFGGPEHPDHVMPFLENVVRGKSVPRERLEEVARRYAMFDGVSPLNGQCRALLAAVVDEFRAHDILLPVYWGNRHWHPLLVDTLRQMVDDGVRRAVTLVTSAFGSYAGCREYLEAVERAREQLGAEAPRIDKLRLFYNHPGFIEPMAERVRAAFEEIPEPRRARATLVFTAHGLPVEMGSGSRYDEQLREACRLVSEHLGRAQWQLAYQSRSGPPSQPWLEPDVGDWLRGAAADGGVADVVVAPIGFVCEHMETLYDLDVEVAALGEELGLNMVRAATVGCHPRFVRMIRELVVERLDPESPRLALGNDGPSHDVCPPGCCPPHSA